MKRLLCLLMALALLCPMALSCLAADPDYLIDYIDEDGYLLEDDSSYVDMTYVATDDRIAYGETVYFPMVNDAYAAAADKTTTFPYVFESSAASKIRFKTDWEEGKSYIDKIAVVKKRYRADNGGASLFTADNRNVNGAAPRYIYFVAVTLRERSTTTTKTVDAFGTISLRKTGDNSFDYDDMEFDVSFEIGFNPPESSNMIPITPALFEPDSDFDSDSSEETFDFEADNYSYFIVNTRGQKKVVLGLDCDYDDDIGERYPDADLEFFNGNGGAFNRTGYLYLYAERGGYVYSIDESNTLTKADSHYDRTEECHVVRTRTLGRYVVSDTKLSLPTVEEEKREDEDETLVVYDNQSGVNYNPTTGGEVSYDPPASTVPGYTFLPSPYAPASSTSAPDQPASSAPAESQSTPAESQPAESEPAPNTPAESEPASQPPVSTPPESTPPSSTPPVSEPPAQPTDGESSSPAFSLQWPDIAAALDGISGHNIVLLVAIICTAGAGLCLVAFLISAIYKYIVKGQYY